VNVYAHGLIGRTLHLADTTMFWHVDEFSDKLQRFKVHSPAGRLVLITWDMLRELLDDGTLMVSAVPEEDAPL
jgi:hypothetical protein